MRRHVCSEIKLHPTTTPTFAQQHVTEEVLTSMGSMSLAMEGERERDFRWDFGSSSRDGVLEGVKLSIESTCGGGGGGG